MTSLQQSLGTLFVRNIKRRIRQNQIEPKTSKSNSKGQKGTTLLESGRLANSIKYRVDGEQIIIGTNVKYAKIHQEGGIITPSNKKFLTIPLTTAAKVKRATDFDNTYVKFYFDEGKNYGLIFLKREDLPDLPIYKLVKRVKIPQRKFLYITENDLSQAEIIVNKYLNNQFKVE